MFTTREKVLMAVASVSGGLGVLAVFLFIIGWLFLTEVLTISSVVQ